MAAADGVAGDQRNDDFGHGADELLHVEDVETRHAVAAHVTRVTAHALVAARAEGVFAILVWTGAGQEHHANGGVLTRVDQGVVKLKRRFGTERIALLRAVDGDLRDAIDLVIQDVFVGLGGFPDRKVVAHDNKKPTSVRVVGHASTSSAFLKIRLGADRPKDATPTT